MRKRLQLPRSLPTASWWGNPLPSSGLPHLAYFRCTLFIADSISWFHHPRHILYMPPHALCSTSWIDRTQRPQEPCREQGNCRMGGLCLALGVSITIKKKHANRPPPGREGGKEMFYGFRVEITFFDRWNRINIKLMEILLAKGFANILTTANFSGRYGTDSAIIYYFHPDYRFWHNLLFTPRLPVPILAYSIKG